MKRKALSYEGRPSNELRRYRAGLLKCESRKFTVIEEKQLIAAVKGKRAVFLGDFHTFDQNSRNLERLLRHLNTHGKDFVLGVEMVKAQYQVFIDAFLKRHITEMEFLESIDYRESWRFPWPHYKIIFDLARKHHFRVIALNSEGTLSERDEFAANLITHHLTRNPLSKMFILFGELHLVADKIPSLVEKQMNNQSFDWMIIHQNLDSVWFRTKRRNVENSIVKFNDREYALQTSPPWVKYEGLLYWYENTSDDPDFDIHEYLIERGLKTLGGDTHDHFVFLTKEILRVLGVKIVGKALLEDFNLVDHTAMTHVLATIRTLSSIHLKKLCRWAISNSVSFKIPGKRLYYCPSYSINRLASLAGVHAMEITAKNNLEMKIEKDAPLFFQIFRQALFGYLGSKILNPHRKCDLYLDLKHKLSHKEIVPNEKKAISIALAFLDSPRTGIALMKSASPEVLLLSGRSCGHIFGEELFNHLSAGENAIEKIHPLLFAQGNPLGPVCSLKKILFPDKSHLHRKKRFF